MLKQLLIIPMAAAVLAVAFCALADEGGRAVGAAAATQPSSPAASTQPAATPAPVAAGRAPAVSGAGTNVFQTSGPGKSDPNAGIGNPAETGGSPVMPNQISICGVPANMGCLPVGWGGMWGIWPPITVTIADQNPDTQSGSTGSKIYVSDGGQTAEPEGDTLQTSQHD